MSVGFAPRLPKVEGFLLSHP